MSLSRHELVEDAAAPPKRGTTLESAAFRVPDGADVRLTLPSRTPDVSARRAARIEATACLHSVATGHVQRETHNGSPLPASPLYVTRH